MTGDLLQILQDLQAAGLGPPEPQGPAPTFNPTGMESFLEGFAGANPGPARGFGGNLVAGLTRGLGGAGARVQARRQQFEEDAARRRASADQQRIQATHDYRSTLFNELGSARERTRKKADEDAKRLRDEPPIGSPEYRTQRQRTRDEAADKRGPASPSNEPLVAVQTPDGPRLLPRAQAVGKEPARATRTNQPVKGADRQALAYYNRGKEALETINAPDTNGSSLEQRVSANIGGQLGLQYAPNFMKSPEQKAYRQAQRAFTEARLRKESGAAIPPHEYEADAQTYFVQPGDDETTIEQKRIARDVVLQGLAYGSGPAYEEFYGEPFKAASITAPAGSAASRTQPATFAPKPGGFFAKNLPKAGK